MPVVIIAAVVIVAIGVTLGIVLNLPKDASPQPAATDAAYAPGASSNDGGNSGSGSSQGASSADDGVTGMGTGPIETIEVPNVVGMTEAEAIRAIENAGLKVGDVKSMASESVAKGKVISQTPEAPSWLAAGAVNTFKVSITVSEGSKQSDDFIFEDSDQRYLADQEIRALSDWERYIARNEIYARHGRGFLNQDLRDYFAGKDWYQERYSPQEFDAMGSGVLNDYERKNAERIRGIEEGFNSPYLK
jgi:hypothetical protein